MVYIDEGRIIEDGKPEDIFYNPKNPRLRVRRKLLMYSEERLFLIKNQRERHETDKVGVIGFGTVGMGTVKPFGIKKKKSKKN